MKIQLIYASAAFEDFSHEDLRQLLATARRNNTALGITGMLVYQDGSFLQVLEGEEVSVMPLYEKIKSDTRHTKHVLLSKSEVEETSFGDWSMGFYDGDANAVETLPGYKDFFGAKFSVTGFKHDADRARALLLHFREGRWHRNVQA